MKFRTYKKDDTKGYRIQGVAFSDDEEENQCACTVGFFIERKNYPTYKDLNFEFGTEANKLGLKLFDLLDKVFQDYGELNEINKVEGWNPRIATVSFKVSLHASWHVEEDKWKNLTREIDQKFGIPFEE